MSIADLSRGLASLVNAIPAYLEAERYYDGSVDEIYHGKKMQQYLTKNNASKLRINFAKTAVDTVANRIEVAGLTATDPDATTVLNDLWDNNELDVEFPGLVEKALIYGDAYLVLSGDDGDGVELHYNSPRIMRMIYASDNPRKKAFAIKRWEVQAGEDAKDTRLRVNLYYPDVVERYITEKANTPGEKANEFVPFVTDAPEDTESVLENPYGFIPVYHFRTARPYGRPEHKEAYGPQDSINKLAITHLASIDYLGFPQRYYMMETGLANDVDDFDASVFHDSDEPNATENGPDMNHRATMTPQSSLTADPGGVWALPKGSNPGQFAAAESKNFIESMNHYREMMAQVTTTPVHYFNPQGDAPSGEALRTADGPLVKKVTRRSRAFGGALQDCLNDALLILGIETKTQVHWASATTMDDLDGWRSVALKIGNGIPVRQALIEQGYTPEQLDSWNVPESVYTPVEPVKPAPLAMQV